MRNRVPNKNTGTALQNEGVGSSKICGPFGGLSLPKQRLEVQYSTLLLSQGTLHELGHPEAAVDLETSTQRPGKVVATAFSDSFAFWIMF